MKQKTKLTRVRSGFTLMELLVAIVILITLAAFVFIMLPKMRKRADAAKAAQNMRQVGTLMIGYSTENQGRLPAPRGDVPDGKGGFSQLHWHEAVMEQAYQTVDRKFLRNDQWWEANKPFLRNPLCDSKTKPWPFYWWNPGFAMNLRIARNLGLVQSEDWGPGKNGPQTSGVPLHMISDPGRTPIIAPRGDWHYDYTPDQIKDVNLQSFVVDGKVPILFVDGHVETMKLTEYTARGLYSQPKK
jgi:prepilin-type N-terminal cleavage/methylation domain-containing protein/prepilin-type processing-associated H-X9-DG protein